MTDLSLGVNTCFAVKRWPEPAVWADLVAGNLGLGLVQHTLDFVDLWAPATDTLRAADAVKAACDAAGLVVHSTFTGLVAYSSNLLLDPDPGARRRALDWYRRAIDWTAACGGRATGGHVGAFSVTDWHDVRRRTALEDELRDHLADLAGYAHRAGLDYLMVENLAAAREPATMASIRRLLHDGAPARVPVRLCLDVGHQVVPGTDGDDRDPYAWLRQMARFAPVVQLQQSDAVADHHWPFTEEANLAGRIDGTRVLDAVDDSGAEAVALILEVIPPFEEDDDRVVADMVASARYWRRALDGRQVG